MKKRINNQFGEEIDVLVEGNESSNITIVFVHGFGTDKNEGHNLFADLALDLKKDFRLVRFDFTGYGESDGKQEDVNYEKQTRDLKAVLNWVEEESKGDINIIAHSMGTFVVSMLSPDNIEKTVFSAIPNADTNYLADVLQKKIRSKEGGVVDETGISIYPRYSGEVQKVGARFWEVLRAFNTAKAFSQYAKKTKLIIIHPLQDNVVGDKYLEPYKEIPEARYIEVKGDHNYSKREDREKVLHIIEEFLKS